MVGQPFFMELPEGEEPDEIVRRPPYYLLVLCESGADYLVRLVHVQGHVRAMKPRLVQFFDAPEVIQ